MLTMILEAKRECGGDVAAIETARAISVIGEEIAVKYDRSHRADCKEVESRIRSDHIGFIWTVSVALSAKVSSNSVACDVAKEWKEAISGDGIVPVVTVHTAQAGQVELNKECLPADTLTE